jgi:RNA polymerase sigma-70 factor (ECF subfamily)
MPRLEPSPEAAADTAARPAELDEELASFEQVYALYFRFSWRVLLHLGVPREALDDAAQELWLVVHRRLEQFEQRSQLKTWLFGIALNVARNHRRSELRRARGQTPPAELFPTVPDPEMLHAAQQAWDRVQTFLATLDEQRRAIFVCSLLEQMSAAETAEATGLDVTAVYHRTRSLRQSFKSFLGKQEAKHDD